MRPIQIWALDPRFGEAGEALHRQILRQLLVVKQSITNETVVAELGRFLLQIHLWRQVLLFHNRTMNMPVSRIVKLASAEGHVCCTQW